MAEIVQNKKKLSALIQWVKAIYSNELGHLAD